MGVILGFEMKLICVVCVVWVFMCLCFCVDGIRDCLVLCVCVMFCCGVGDTVLFFLRNEK